MNVIEILNTIRDNASATYQERIPEATRENLETIRYAMIDDGNICVANEFAAALMNKLVKSQVHNKIFKNPLKTLKKGKKPLGDTVEEIYTNFIKGKQYDAEGKELLNRHLPDVKTVYHRMNSQMKYPLSISRAELSRAFASEDALEKFITNCINTLYNSAELDEFVNMKQLFASAIEKNAMKMIEVVDPLDGPEEAKEYIKTVKTISGLMVFPKKEFNAYSDVQTEDPNPVTTFTRKDEQVLILDTAVDTGVSVDVLASLFNMTVAEFNDTKKIVIDCFPAVAGKRIVGALVDEQFFQIYDDLFTIATFNNGDGLYDSYYLHVWMTYAFSVLVNAVAFYVPVTE